MKKLTLGTKILIGMVLGVFAGLILGPNATYLQPFGDLFLRAMQLVILPLIIASIPCAIFQAGDMRSFGRIGGKTLLYFLLTTSLGICVGLTVAQLIQPGIGMTLDVDTSSFVAPTTTSPGDMLLGLVAPNIFAALSSGGTLQVIVFAILLGIAILYTGDKGNTLKAFFQSFSDVMFKFIELVCVTAPYGVFCLMAVTTGKHGLDVLLPLISVIITLTVAVCVQVLVVYIPILKLNGYPIAKFFRVTAKAVYTAFASGFSSVALPLSFEAQQELGVSEKVRNFVLPLGMTVNMNGTAIYLSICATFVANIYGIELDMTALLTIVVSGVLAAVGATTTYMAGLIMLTLVLTTVGLPLEGIALVAGVEAILNMIRTSMNVLGDNVSSVAVACSENEVDKNTTPKEHV